MEVSLGGDGRTQIVPSASTPLAVPSSSLSVISHSEDTTGADAETPSATAAGGKRQTPEIAITDSPARANAKRRPRLPARTSTGVPGSSSRARLASGSNSTSSDPSKSVCGWGVFCTSFMT